MQELRARAAENQRNSEAESAHVRRQVWGDSTSKADDDMGTTILGDITQSPPIVFAPQQSNNLWPLIAMGLAATVPVAGLGAAGVGAAAAYMLSQPEKKAASPETPDFEDSTVSIGLGRIEDFEIK